MSQYPYPSLYPPCTGGAGQTGGAGAQATYTPINCNVTIATLCTPLCGAASQGGGASAQSVSLIFCGAPSVPGGGASAPQATYTPINCNVTIATLCTPLCGAAAQGGGASAQSVSLIFCGAPAPQATYTPINCNVTIATLCTPLCGAAAQGVNPGGTQGLYPPALNQSTTIAAPPQGGGNGGAAAQGTFTPVNCQVTVFSLCTPIC